MGETLAQHAARMTARLEAVNYGNGPGTYRQSGGAEYRRAVRRGYVLSVPVCRVCGGPKCRVLTDEAGNLVARSKCQGRKLCDRCRNIPSARPTVSLEEWMAPPGAEWEDPTGDVVVNALSSL